VGGADWAGIVLTDNDTTVGMMCVLLYLLVSFLPTVEHTHRVQRSWFLRDGESGLHSFLRLGYHNATGPSLGRLGESRTMFRPNGGPWTHIVTNSEQWVRAPHAQFLCTSLIMTQAPLPSAEALSKEVSVQDACVFEFRLGG
jgi:rhamnogalacturonan endolyase